MNNENIEKILNELGTDKIPDDVLDIAEQASRDFEKTLTQPKQPRKILLLEYIMKSQITKIAAAILIVLAVFTISQLGGSSVAWAEVAERVDNVKSFIYRITVNPNISESEQIQLQQVDLLIYSSNDYGSRIENYVGGELSSIFLMNFHDNIFVTIMPGQRIYFESPLTQEQIDEMIVKQDPRQIIRQMLMTDYKKLGRDTINGIEVESIEVTGETVLGGAIENVTARLWVDTNMEFPVLLEVDGFASGTQNKMSMVVKDFQWNVDLDQSLFTDIPSDYTEIETGN